MKQNRITNDKCPKSIEELGNGFYYYNYDIKESSKTTEDNKLVKEWSYVQVKLFGEPNYKDCVKAIIRTFVTQEEEFDLINSYNRVATNLTKSVSDKDKYFDYLNKVSEIKVNIKADFEK